MTILENILAWIEDTAVHFVFPSAVVARFWAECSVRASGKPLALQRFSAWDDFKITTLSRKEPEQYPANRALRLIFASDLLRSNATQTGSFLHEYINPDYAESYSSFAAPLAALLPSLQSIAERIDAQQAQDDYFQDLLLIKERYQGFLQENKVYEPSWNKAPFHAQAGTRWLLFFPELCEDWYEYREELQNAEDVQIIRLDSLEAPVLKAQQEQALAQILGAYKRRFIHFPFSGDEYRWLVLTVRRLLDEAHLHYEDISITLTDETEPERLIQAFRLHDIAVEFHHKKPLPEHPAGRIFTHLAECRGKRWSYQSLKNLLLDKAFPWKDTQLINALLEAGIHYRCVSNFTEKHLEYDTWDRSLWEESTQTFDGIPVPKIKQFYRRLKKSIESLLNARTFSELRGSWYAFETTYFDSSALSQSQETVHIIKEIMKALNQLIAMEDRFPTLLSGMEKRRSCFPVFQSYLQQTAVTGKTDQHAIALYGYKVAAGIGTPVHFIINVNQNDATVLYTGGAAFLREDRRTMLALQNRDMSSEFIRAYSRMTPFVIFTVSKRTFSGVMIPHSKLSEEGLEELPFNEKLHDYYEEEWSSSFRQMLPLVRPTEAQKRGWDAYTKLKAQEGDTDFRHERIADKALKAALKRRLGKQKYFFTKAEARKEEPERFSIAPTDLNEYILCPFKWLLERGLAIQEKQTDIETINQKDLGILYHAILEEFFTRLKSSHSRFRAEDIAEYTANYLSPVIKEVLLDAEHKEGFFQKSLYAILENRIKSALLYYLENDKETLNGAEIVGAEYPLHKTYPEYDCMLSGIADLIMCNEDGNYTIVDYKTGSIPTKKEISLAADEAFPKNIQMASYIAMLEQGGQKTVHAAHFYSLNKRTFNYVIKGGDLTSRQDYEPAVKAVDTVFELLCLALEHGDYRVPNPPDRKLCMRCAVAPVCRILY
ncbi:MAG: PD-(D/E)XK nuclease family protein [Spirochaetaceae bacterium]|jgi:RecB family exonuclease|nr:PD-(D/E)XK nuclease family protein [Spirochaetaceae bacterium]